MGLLVEMVVGPALGLAGAAVVFTALDRTLRQRGVADPRPRRAARERWLDVAYWFLAPLSSNFVRIPVIASVVVVAVFSGVSAEEIAGHLAARRTFVADLPSPLQALVALLVLDFVGYWLHRALHRAPLWRLHALHHAPRELDWLSAVRNHPVAEIGTKILQIAPLVALGVPLRVLGPLGPVVGGFTAFLHTDVRASFGPLRYVIATPAFHRWHHATDDARGRNFAGIFPIWDLLFGTFDLPAQAPRVFGADAPVPAGFFAQLVWPFR